MEDGSTERQSCGWGQDYLQEKDEGLRGRDLQMSTYRLRLLSDRRGALLTHPSNSVDSDTFGDDSSGQGRRAAPL